MVAAHEQGDGAGVVGQVHHGLAGGVAAAEDVDVLVGAPRRLGCSGAVVEAGAGVFAGQVEPVVLDSGGADVGPGGEGAAGGEVDDDAPVAEGGVDALLEKQDFRAECDGLLSCSFGQAGAADAAGEAEVVLDEGAGSGLAADGVAFEQDGMQTFGGGVDGGAEPSGAGAVDGDVVFGGGGCAEPAEPVRD